MRRTLSARPHVPLVIERDPAQNLVLAMSLADVCSCLADEDISCGDPIKRLVRIIFSAPSADGIEPPLDPFFARSGRLRRRRIRQMAHRNRENTGNRNWPCLFPLYPGQPCRRIACAPSAGATSISVQMRRASSTSGRISRRRRRSCAASPGKRLLHEVVHVMHLTSRRGDIPSS
jgi:hypothetical protein